MEVQRGTVSCLRSHSKEEAELGFEPKTLAVFMLLSGAGALLPCPPWGTRREGIWEVERDSL